MQKGLRHLGETEKQKIREMFFLPDLIFCTYSIALMLKIRSLWRIFFVILRFVFLFPFPRSAYPCTPLARQPKILALNPFAPLVRSH